jgi:hypothetical protein
MTLQLPPGYLDVKIVLKLGISKYSIQKNNLEWRSRKAIVVGRMIFLSKSLDFSKVNDS